MLNRKETFLRNMNFFTVPGAEGYAVAQLVEAPRYKPEGSGFDSPWCHVNFSLTYSFRPHFGPWVDSASDRNKYQKYFLDWGKDGRYVALHVPIVLKFGCLKLLETSGLLQDCNEFALPLPGAGTV
jgi:hypothetical protein